MQAPRIRRMMSGIPAAASARKLGWLDVTKETLEVLNTISGFLGDTITFIGAFMIAVKEAGEYKRLRQEVGASKAYKENPKLKQLLIEVDGLLVQNGEDVKVILAKRASNISRRGAQVLAVGFGFLIIARVCETIVRYCY